MSMDWDPENDAQVRRDRIRNWLLVAAVTAAVIGLIVKAALWYEREKAEKRARFGHSEYQQPPVGRQLGPAGQLTSGSSERGLCVVGPSAWPPATPSSASDCNTTSVS
jgi:hypothetical protein